MKQINKSLAVAVCLCTALSIPAFAAEGGEEYVDTYVPSYEIPQALVGEEVMAERVEERAELSGTTEVDPVLEPTPLTDFELAVLAEIPSLLEASYSQEYGVFVSAELNSTTLQPYTGKLDPVTGLPVEDVKTITEVVEEDEEVVVPDTIIVRRTGELAYNETQKMYITYISGESVLSSHPSGALTTNSIDIEIPSTLTFTIYKDGTAVTTEDNAFTLSSKGTYLIKVGKATGTTTDMIFTIIGTYTNSVTEYSIPDGFNIEELYIDGEAVTPDYANYVAFTEDAKYVLVYADVTIDRRYTLTFTKDTVAPVLEIPGVVNGVASGAVTLSSLESNTSLYYTFNGETISVSSLPLELTEAGDYCFVNTDLAGNKTILDLHIQMYLNITAVLAIFLVSTLGAGVFIYSRWVRKNAKIG